MTTMKYPNVPGGTTTNMAVSGNGSHHHHVDEVDFFGTSGWPNPNGLMQNDYVDVHSLTLEGSLNLGNDKLLLGSPTGHETDIDSGELDKLLSFNSQHSNLAELKPLPPFTGYTANLSINGIPGHHYHTISQRVPEENNNNYNNYTEQIVSSSTCNVSADSSGGKWDEVVKLEYGECVNDVTNSVKLYDECNADSSHVKGEMESYDNISGIDFAKFIGSSMADTTVPNNADPDEQGGSRESWMDFDALMENAIPDQKNLIISEGISEFVMSGNANSNYQEYNPQKMPQGGSTLQSLLTHGSSSMPLLQNRLQNGPPIKQEAPSSTNFNNDLISTSSPPANVGSTTDNLLMNANGRFTMQQYNVHGLVDDHHRIRSPDTMLGQNYPHTTTSDTRPTGGPARNKRSRAQRKQQQAASSTVFPTEPNLAMMTGKEKTIHRCTICNRGFLNKSNIKVHMRTHTGEKPFRCETCSKAFRQKAHLLKHQQIHKRIGRD